MNRLWFKVWQQGQAVDPPIQVASLPRGARIVGNLAVRRGRDNTFTAVYALAADPAHAQEIWAEARGLRPEYRPLLPPPRS